MEIGKRIIEDRRKIHGFAEVGFDTERTASYVEKRLIEMGYEPKRCGRSGIIADIGDGDEAVLLRADMDALPVEEESGEPFSSVCSSAHLCGHDMHTAMLLGAADILTRNRDKIRGRIRLMFQPSEENLCGCLDMIEAGALDGARFSRAIMLHVLIGTDTPKGRVVFPGCGVSTAASDFFKYTIKGKSGHGADPGKAHDALRVGAKVLTGVLEMSAVELSVREPVTLSFGSFSGGSAPNVIADRAELCGTLRTYADGVRTKVLDRMRELGQGIGALYGTPVELELTSGCPSFITDRALADSAASVLERELGITVIRTPDGTLGGGSEDFSYVSQLVPSLMVLISAGSRAEGYEYPLHHPKVRFSEDILPLGAQIYATLALM